MDKVIWATKTNVFVVKKGKTSNNKITEGDELAVQTYTFSHKQWLLATTEKGFGMKKFFELDDTNCLDCPFSGNSGNGGCYTHKFNQYMGMLSMLRSIKPEQLTPLTADKIGQCIEMSKGIYVRFGTYGEPSLMPFGLVNEMALVADEYTGYTHQWQKEWAKPYGQRFMASSHTQDDADYAKQLGFRSFIATKDGNVNGVQCPASKEANYKSNCAACGLCSGTLGKGRKDVKIFEH